MKTAIRVGVATILLFFGGLGSWAVLAPLDGAIVGSGTLAVHGNRKTIQHREGGIVAELLVHDGAQVEQDQLLIRLDDTQARALFTVHLSQLMADRALVARVLAELADAPEINFPDDVGANDDIGASVRAREIILFNSRRDLLRRQLAILDQRIEQSQHQANGARVQLTSTVRQLGFAEEEYRSIAELERSGLASKNRLLEVSRAAEALRGQVGQLSTDVSRLSALTVELEAEKLRLRDATQSEATREMREAQLRINDMLPRLAADRDVLSRLNIRAPIAGEVVNLAIFTKGGVVEAGRPVMDIVPRARTIVAEAEIRPEDVERLSIGQRADIIAVGFNPRENAPITGEVRVISADRVTEPRTGHSFFRAEVALIADQQGGALLSRLGPGMPVEVIVPIAPRSAFDYLIGPLRDSFRTAWREM
ncbi:MAG: HlyD family type I secretion periplasmic adaptor subunit [Acetobacteraceae bacterium]